MLAVLLAATLAFSEKDALLAYDTASNLVARCTPRDAGTPRGALAANFILDAAASHGANARLDRFSADTPAGPRNFTNVVAEWRNDDDAAWVVVISHYDTKPFAKCPGANDGASTTGILVALADVISSRRDLPFNIMLMWLDGEECMYSYGKNDGFWGSRHAAAALKKSGRRVKAVICIDMLGDANLTISIPRNSSAALRRIALDAAKRAGHEGVVREMRELVKDDHVAFLREGFPAIDLIDFEYGSAAGLNDYWHTPNDTIDKVSVSSLRTAGEILCQFINALF